MEPLPFCATCNTNHKPESGHAEGYMDEYFDPVPEPEITPSPEQ